MSRAAIDPGRLELLPLKTPACEAAYHAIRRVELLERYEPGVAYNPDGFDERRPCNMGHVLLLDGEVVGTIRIDLVDAERAGLRLVAVKGELKSRGLGAWMLQRAEAIVAAHGRRSIIVNASRPAVQFYLRQGYAPVDWPDVRPLDARLNERLGKLLSRP
jgi:GNAT superfamily N-acetyltransferase